MLFALLDKTERIAARMSSSPSMEQEILARQPIGWLGGQKRLLQQ